MNGIYSFNRTSPSKTHRWLCIGCWDSRCRIVGHIQRCIASSSQKVGRSMRGSVIYFSNYFHGKHDLNGRSGRFERMRIMQPIHHSSSPALVDYQSHSSANQSVHTATNEAPLHPYICPHINPFPIQSPSTESSHQSTIGGCFNFCW